MNAIRRRLEAAPQLPFTLYATLAAFCAYACMYAFRKPFTVATYEETAAFLGLSFKTCMVISQVLGYGLAKFIGIKVVSEMKATGRAISILGLVAVSQLAWLLFGFMPAPWNLICLFFNGLPLGLLWGLVFSYVEGRRFTEIMGLGLCASFTFAAGFVKDVGRWVMSWGVDEFWMPFVTGLVFALPVIIFTLLLDQIPPPGPEDEAERTRREPMSGPERKAFFRRFAPGLILLVVVYVLLTAYRDFRENFMEEILVAIEGANHNISFSGIEGPASLGVLGVLMLLVLVKNNFKALMINYLAVGLGVCLAGIATWGFQAGWWGAWWWMFLTGYATFLGYIPFNSILFDRLIAAYQHVATVGFLIYVADAFGYVGSIGILLYKEFGAPELSWVEFFSGISYVLAIMGLIGILLASVYFWRRYRQLSLKASLNQKSMDAR